MYPQRKRAFKHFVVWAIATLTVPLWAGVIAGLVVMAFAGSFVLGRWCAQAMGWY